MQFPNPLVWILLQLVVPSASHHLIHTSMRQIWTIYRHSDLFSVLLLTRFKNIFTKVFSLFLSVTPCCFLRVWIPSLSLMEVSSSISCPSCDLILRLKYICFNKLGAIFIAPWFWPLFRKWPFSFSLFYSQHHKRLFVKCVPKYKRGFLIKITLWIFNNGFDNITE